MTGVNEIRSTFLDFFKSKGHEIVPSSSLVPQNDPTLMFTNAGMVPFKSVFTGAETRDYNRAVSSQKCVRAGGKHNDLDNVGRTARHHTFFEMLGNFSFGDYFKEGAIEFAWELVTKEFALDKKRLLVTVYADDDEAFDLWKKIAGLPEEKILRIATSDNFWSMGETGPCGPCSEIFYDHGDHLPGGPPGTPEEDGDRFIEIWNLVFMQYDQVTKDNRENLPKPSIDTGMGLERISAVLQGTHDNYEIDLIRSLIAASADETNVAPDGKHSVSHRVIADHLRSSSFLIADGVSPSNEGRGYVLRRIMRRAMRHAHLLGADEPLMHKLVPSLVREMGQAFPELNRAQALITETLKLEETRFRKTLERGLHLLDEATGDLGEGDELSGDVAFKLYDTYGFPLDLTQDALKSRSISVDTDGFDAAMAKQKEEARKAWAGSGEEATDDVWYEILERVGITEFLGYQNETANGEIVATLKTSDKGTKTVKELRKGDEGAIILNQTPFYGESGGQVGDQGVITLEKGATFKVTDTKKKLGNLFVHYGIVEKGSFKTGAEATLNVDSARREATRSNHSATHLLHEALREVLGDHVAQKGSLVEPGRLRFDFSHPKPMEPDEVVQVEQIANKVVQQNADVITRVMPVDDAIESGALALFGEKYGDEVRVVSMGDHILPELKKQKKGKAYSVELCGGIHVNRTGDIGLIRILNESAVASGVRRIEALTSQNARDYLSLQDQRVREVAQTLKTKPEDVLARVSSLMEERKNLEKELSDAKRKLALGGGSGGSAEDAVREVSGIKFLSRTLQGVPAKDLKGLVDDGKKQIGSGIVAMVGVSEEGKAGIVVGVTDDLTSDYNAVDLVRAGAAALGGKGGGGRPDMAQAGGPDADGAENALEAIAEKLAG